MDNKAQISLEMLLVAAAVIAVAILLISNLKDTASDASNVVGNSSTKAIKEIKAIK